MSPATGTRRPRADALRNRQLIIEAAAEAFREHGLDVSVAEIGRRAGVGSGTLYRNFPTKHDLIRAIVESRIRRWQEVIEAALESEDAAAAFEDVVDEVLEFSFRERGQMEAFKERLLDEPDLLQCKNEAFALTDQLLDRAKAASVLRTDITTDDFYCLAAGLAESARMSARAEPDDDSAPCQLYRQIFLDGLRPSS